MYRNKNDKSFKEFYQEATIDKCSICSRLEGMLLEDVRSNNSFKVILALSLINHVATKKHWELINVVECEDRTEQCVE
jgi:hypothetical protein